MKKTPDFDDEMLPEYQFDYGKAKPNRFAQQQPTRACHQSKCLTEVA